MYKEGCGYIVVDNFDKFKLYMGLSMTHDMGDVVAFSHAWGQYSVVPIMFSGNLEVTKSGDTILKYGTVTFDNDEHLLASELVTNLAELSSPSKVAGRLEDGQDFPVIFDTPESAFKEASLRAEFQSMIYKYMGLEKV